MRLGGKTAEGVVRLEKNVKKKLPPPILAPFTRFLLSCIRCGGRVNEVNEYVLELLLSLIIVFFLFLPKVVRATLFLFFADPVSIIDRTFIFSSFKTSNFVNTYPFWFRITIGIVCVDDAIVEVKRSALHRFKRLSAAPKESDTLGR